MKKKMYGIGKGLIALLVILCATQTVDAQVGIGTNTPDPSAQLQIESTNKGLLIPRVNSTADVATPATGLMVYQTGTDAGFYYNSGNAQNPNWVKVATGSLEIADGSITQQKLAPGSVTSTALATYAVGTTQLAPGSVTADKVNTTSAMPGQVLTYSGSNGLIWADPAGTTPLVSAYLPSMPAAMSTSLSGWTITSPYYNNSMFDAQTGTFTVPATGRYQINALLNYSTTAAITVSLGAGIFPSFVVRRTAPITTDLLVGSFPIMDVNIALVLYMRTIMAAASVPVSGTVELNAGDVIQLFYEADGLTIPLTLGGGAGHGMYWSITRVQ